MQASAATPATPAVSGGSPGVAPDGTPTAQKLEDWIGANQATWQNVRNGLNSSDPAMKQKAAAAVAYLRTIVTDPETLDEMVRE